MQTYQHCGWSALGDRTRRAIFERLVDRPCAVGEFAIGLPVSRPAVSQHFKVLKDAGLVVGEAVGNRRIYRLNPAGLVELRADLDRSWLSALTAYKAVVEHPNRRSHEYTCSSDVDPPRDRRPSADRAGVLGLHRRDGQLQAS